MRSVLISSSKILPRRLNQLLRRSHRPRRQRRKKSKLINLLKFQLSQLLVRPSQRPLLHQSQLRIKLLPIKLNLLLSQLQLPQSQLRLQSQQRPKNQRLKSQPKLQSLLRPRSQRPQSQLRLLKIPHQSLTRLLLKMPQNLLPKLPQQQKLRRNHRSICKISPTTASCLKLKSLLVRTLVS